MDVDIGENGEPLEYDDLKDNKKTQLEFDEATLRQIYNHQEKIRYISWKLINDSKQNSKISSPWKQ